MIPCFFFDICHTNQQCQLQESDITKGISFRNCNQPSFPGGILTANVVIIEYSCFQGNRHKYHILLQAAPVICHSHIKIGKNGIGFEPESLGKSNCSYLYTTESVTCK